MNFRAHTIAFVALLAGSATPFHTCAAYHVERITPVMHQPTYLTQAPGDPANIVYYTTRTTTSFGGFGAINDMGKVWRYDLNTRVATEIVSMEAFDLTQDDGLHAIAFHPDFNNPGSNGFGRMFVVSAQRGPGSGNIASNRVDEFTLMNPDGTFKTPAQVWGTLRSILSYPNTTSWNNHTIDWIGFDPTAAGDARYYLYISTGNGTFTSINIDPSQNPSDLKGKLLRVDISGGDDYPGDAGKNFAIPPSNPLPTYNAAHPGSPIAGLGEVFLTGLRNAYRVSFDRATGDIYYGDVGENNWEEISFIQAGSNDLGPPRDFGWPEYEGTHGGINPTNPFTGVLTTFPIREYSHGTGQCAIGGYVYRGPITELQGKYFFADFVAGRIWMLDFDRDTDPNTFGGTNGTLTDITATWEGLVSDSTVMGYAGDHTITGLAGLDHIVSFGEDNQGNLYLVDFSYGTGFDTGQYRANSGEIFLLMPDSPTLIWKDIGTELELSWIGDFKLQTQTNSLSPNWADVPGGNTSPVPVPIDQLRGTALFRLQSLP